MTADLSRKQKVEEIFDIFQKAYTERTLLENNKLANSLFNVEYFKKYIVDQTQRQEYINAMLPYLKYGHFPKGTAICHQGDTGVEFGIILQGSALVYGLKDREQFRKEAGNGEKFDKFKQNRRIIDETGFYMKLRNWHTQKYTKIKTSHHNKGSPGKPSSLIQHKDSYKEAAEELDATFEEIISLFKNIYGGFDEKYGIKIEDLLLLLHHDSLGHEYFKEGVPLYKVIKELKEGDTMEELGLLTGVSVKNTIIASEDLHIVTIAQGDFYSLFNIKVPSLIEKRDFIWSVFPDLVVGIAIKIASVAEEKVYMNWEIIYDQGEEPEAFFILKSGEVQLFTFEESEEKSKIPFSAGLIDGTKRNFNSKQKLAIGTIGPGSLFGEEEVLTQSRRKYQALCLKSPTLVYVIKCETYYEILEKYFPNIPEAINSVTRVTTKWREDRLAQGKKVNQELSSNSPLKKGSKDRMKIRSTRLLNPLEAQVMKIHLNRPELIFETHSVKITNFEERNSRNIRNKIEITTCDPDNKLESPYKKLIDSSKSKVIKSQKTKRPQSSSETRSPNTTKIKHDNVMKIKSKLFQRSEAMGLPANIVEQYLQQIKSTCHISSQNSLLSPPVSPKSTSVGNFSLQCNLANTIKRSPQEQRISIEAATPGRKSFHLETPSRASFPNALSLETMANINLFNNSPVPAHSNRPVSEPKIAPKENHKGSLSPKSVRFYQRITSFRPKSKKNTNLEGAITDSKSIHVRSLSHTQIQKMRSPQVPKLDLTLQRSNMSQIDFLSNHKNSSLSDIGLYEKTPKARNSPGAWKMPQAFWTPKVSTAATVSTSNFETSIFQPTPNTPKKIFMLNRGKEDPKPMVFDVESVRISERKGSVSFMNTSPVKSKQEMNL